MTLSRRCSTPIGPRRGTTVIDRMAEVFSDMEIDAIAEWYEAQRDEVRHPRHACTAIQWNRILSSSRGGGFPLRSICPPRWRKGLPT